MKGLNWLTLEANYNDHPLGPQSSPISDKVFLRRENANRTLLY